MSIRENTVRKRYIFRGVIQGVGFRPTVYRCASSLGLSGFVRNQRSEVLAEVQGDPDTVERFPAALAAMLPAAASIESFSSESAEVRDEQEFRIVESAATSYSFPPIPPDLALCDDCRRELMDASNRRHLYPFITCTQCGPRYSIVEDTPFDRDTTSMVDFPQCGECLEEYTDPGNRRFHAQTNACARCGPNLSLLDPQGGQVPGDPLAGAIEALGRGAIVAVQGIGGFHLAADPRSADAMRRLREDKEREGKPFALMVADLEEAERLGILAESDRRLLDSAASPIVIVPLRAGAPGYLEAVSHTGTLGVMLPYTPLHLLLFSHPKAMPGYRSLVMTSGNLKGEPIITEPGEALTKLHDVADLFLVHDRRILFRTDDSVARTTFDGEAVLLRRSRGYVPRLLSLAAPLQRTVLAVGGDLKNAPALGKGRDVHLAPYIGDLEDPLTREDFERQVHQILTLYGTQPEVVALDLHPGYHSSEWARRFEAGRHVEIQHHHAHILSVMAEHGLEEVLGLSFDGTGYGPDGTIWGGEFLQARRDGFRRFGWVAPFGLPGGEAAILHPLRIALSILSQAMSPAELEELFCGAYAMPPESLATLSAMAGRGINAPLTSSMGRVFDAAAALLGLVERTSYEGEGPIRMEGMALRYRQTGASRRGAAPALAGRFGLQEHGESFVLTPGPLLRELAALRREQPRSDPGGLALAFHAEIARGALEGARWMRRRTGLGAIALSGGVFQNVLLHELLVPELRREGFEVFRNRSVPPGDGGIALGQVYFIPGNL